MKMVLSMKVLLLVVVGLIGLTSALCPKGFAAIKNNCFRVSHRGNNNWNEAWRDCASRSGYLAEFSEHGKMQNLADYLDTIDGSHYSYWIGGGDGIEQDDWRWVISGVPIGALENTRWCPGHPVSSVDVNALVLDPDRSYCWQSVNANLLTHPSSGKTIGYICEAEPVNTYMAD